ncbi:MAG: TetR/AcrR family transcriptional regulator, partial [Nocardioides sp.]|nr:TetR/AcrR family transcriptional regulator [Nocardioides sp.]
LSSQRIRADMEAKVADLPFETDYLHAFDEITRLWVEFYYDNPRDRMLQIAVTLEHDPHALEAAREGVNRHYRELMGAIIDIGIMLGHLRADIDRDAVVAMCILLEPHIALAPHVRGLDPLLDLEGSTREYAVKTAQRLAHVIIEQYLVEK